MSSKEKSKERRAPEAIHSRIWIMRCSFFKVNMFNRPSLRHAMAPLVACRSRRHSQSLRLRASAFALTFRRDSALRGKAYA